MAILTIVIGIVFVLLLLSLLATTVMELIASLFKLRGKNLIKALRNLLASSDTSESVLNAFQDNSLYKQLTQQYGRKSTGPPSYIAADTFQSILFDIILKGEGVEKLKEKIDALPDEDLKNVLNQLLQDANNELDDFKVNVQKWYNDVMDRASGWYKRYTRKILIGVGLAIAVIFNADTLAIYERLESNPEALQKIVNMAEVYVQANDSIPSANPDPEFEQSLANVKVILNDQIEAIKSPLGLGWKNVDLNKATPYDWFTKILGYIVTALSISLGAPFWFDLLRKIVNIRSSGNKPS